MNILAIAVGFCLDLILADPAWMPHPVVWMGRFITAAEKLLRKVFPKTSAGERGAGVFLVLALLCVTGVISFGAIALANWVSPYLSFALQVLWCWQVLALKGLKQEAMAVYKKLEEKDLPAARTAVARIVGRDTESLSEEGVTKAAVETVAENFSDGVLAPLFYLFLGGAPLALLYKAVNTMDSMVGYKNERYLFFGWAAAKLDDIVNFIPSRIAALLWIAASGLAGQNSKNAFRVWRRDRRNHASPNSAQTEAACAGALGVRLAGPASYFGKAVEKPYIGDALRPIEPKDIEKACKVLYLASSLALLLGVLLCKVILLYIGGNAL